MVYVLEFFAIDLDGNRLLLEAVKHCAKSLVLAHAYGESMMRNTLIRDRKATICVIKDQTGHALGEMRANS